MFKTSKILFGNYSSLFRSICFVSNNSIFAKSWNVARVGTRTHRIYLSSSLQISGSKDERGGVCLRRSNSNSSYVTPSGVIFHFDTHKLVKRMQENGFSEVQAESLTMSLVEIVSSSFGGIADSTVSKIDQERLEVKFTALLDTMRNEMFLLEKGKFAQIEEENERLRAEVKSLKGILQDEVAKLKGGMALDFSLEKSRIKEELAVRDQKIKDTENRIETEVAKLGTQLEAQKLDLIKYLVGSLLSCTTLFLAVWRFVKT